MKTNSVNSTSGFNRRSFLRSGAALAALAPSLGFLASSSARAQVTTDVTDGDIAILKFLAAAELVEDDLWQQYCELAVNNNPYQRALSRIDRSLPRYICDDRDDERSHALFINGFLASIGEEPVNLDAFRTLPSSPAVGAEQRGRLTSLTNLTIDTSWYYRYRSSGNPDFGDTFPQVVEIVNQSALPIRRGANMVENQTAAHVSALHFATIEQGGGSLYLSLMQKVTSLDALCILTSIGPVEIYHFAAFHKSLEGLFGFRGINGLIVPDRVFGDKSITRAIFPEPCTFLSPGLPLCSVIRPKNTENAGAVATATALVQSGLFMGQSQAFFDAVVGLATAADAAQRGV